MFLFFNLNGNTLFYKVKYLSITIQIKKHYMYISKFFIRILVNFLTLDIFY